MGYLIGMDEAGYGPNLGPLVIAASVWRVPGCPRETDLYDLLASCVCAKPSDATDENVCLADSKLVYQPNRGLKLLERGVWASLSQMGIEPTAWNDLWSRLAPPSEEVLSKISWYRENQTPLPLELDAEERIRAADALAAGLKSADVELENIAAAGVFPEKFNDLLDDFDSKGELLSRETLSLLAELLDNLKDQSASESILVICDKHG
ncbi:MAG: hypothetical protein N2C14_17755, partial [Planctomycetales bacterium]